MLQDHSAVKLTYLCEEEWNIFSSLPSSTILQAVLIFFRISTLFKYPERKKQILLLISLNIWLRSTVVLKQEIYFAWKCTRIFPFPA